MSTRLPEEIVPDNDQTRARSEHLERIEALVGNAYPNRFARSRVTESVAGEDTISSVVAQFREHEPDVAEGGRPSPEQLEAANAALGEVGRASISGRLATPPRVMGKAAFVHLSDGKERLQIYVRRQEARAISNDSLQPVEEEESGWKLFQLLDHGDFVGVEGRLFVTKTGELSIHVETIQFLSKALVPMPDKLHGISDPEIRQRQRYADLIASSLKVDKDEPEEGGDKPRQLTTREVFERRSKMITQMRRYLDDHGYIEVETPILSPIASGAAAKPFETYHNALDIKLYARIAPELYLKRLLVGGFERVYELNRNFRNEGISYKHNPEFTMLEFYCAYMDADGMMDFCEEMLRQTVKEAIGGLAVNFSEIEINFGSKFERLTMTQAISKFWSVNETTRFINISIDESKFDDLKYVQMLVRATKMAEHEEMRYEGYKNYSEVENFSLSETKEVSSKEHFFLDVARRAEELVSQPHYKPLGPEESDIAKGIAYLFEYVAEEHLNQPTFITDFPKAISPLSKASPDNPAVAERFELYIAGMECANGFSELNDPAEQYQRFEEQTRQRERGDEEAMQMDVDYVRALSYGMPPAAGIGIGIDRLAMLLTNRRSIRDVILFPHMRPRAQASEASEEASAESAET